MSKHLLILGTGSVGKRHAANLQAMGCSISCMDPRADRLDEARAEGIEMVSGFTSMEAALEDTDFDGIVVGSPTAFHVDQCIAALDKKIPVLLEKPVAPDLASAQKLARAVEQTSTPLLLGYTWRWWPALARVRELLEQEAIGTLLTVRFVMAAHLADWHPWERYQDFFMSSKAMGGGALLDESHWIDLMLWFFGMPESIFGRVEKISDLEISSDDNVDILVKYADGKRIYLHLDLYTRPHEKSITCVGTEGTLKWEVESVKWAADAEGQWQEETFTEDRNFMFNEVAREFLRVLDGKSSPSCTIEDGLKVMSLIEAVRQSTTSGHAIEIGS